MNAAGDYIHICKEMQRDAKREERKRKALIRIYIVEAKKVEA